MVAWSAVEHACNRLVHLAEVNVVASPEPAVTPMEQSEVALLTCPLEVLVAHCSHIGCLEKTS